MPVRLSTRLYARSMGASGLRISCLFRVDRQLSQTRFARVVTRISYNCGARP